MAAQPFSFRRVAVPVFAPSLLFGLGEGAILPAVPLAVRDLGGSVSMAALMVTLLGLGALASNLPASLLTVRYGERRAIVGASIWCALGMLLCVVAPGIGSFAAGILMVGMASAVFGLARLSYLAEAVPAYLRARAMSTLGGVMRIGLFVGPFAAAGVMHWTGLEGAWWVGIAALLAAALLALRLADLPGDEAKGAVRAGPHAAEPTLRSTVVAHRKVFLTLGSCIVVISAVRAARQAIIPLWALHIGLDAACAALVYGLSNAVDMLVFYPAGKLMDTKGRRWVAVPCMAIMGAALMAMAFTTSASPFLLAALVVGFGNGLGSGIVMTLGADHSPPQGRAHFLGVWRLLSDIGGSGGPALLSAVTALFALAVGVAGAGVLAWIGAAMLAFWVPRPGAARKRAEPV